MSPKLKSHVTRPVRGPADARLSRAVKVDVNQIYPQKEAQAHRDLQSRKTTSSTVFTV